MNSYGAVCLDGSVPVIYYRAGTGSGIHKFHVFFRGGGWCTGIVQSQAQCMESCYDRSQGSFGSSTTYPNILDFDDGYLSTDPTVNPLTYNWNSIWVTYWYVTYIFIYLLLIDK